MSKAASLTDAIVIGGGIVGCATAYRLALAGLKVALLERGECGGGASWAGAGIVDPGSHSRSDPLALLRRASVARYPEFIRELHQRSGIDPQFVRCGMLDLITDDNQDRAADREVAAAAGVLTASGEPAVQRIDSKEALSLAPSLSTRSRGARLVRDAVQVRNPRLMAALRLSCIRAGVDLREHTPVVDLLVDGPQATGVLTPNGAMPAGHIVIAAGAWSPGVARCLGDVLPVHPVRGQIVLLEQTPPPLRHIIMCGKKYAVGRLDGKVLIGSTEEPDAGFAADNTAGGVARILGFVEQQLPGLKTATLLRTWAGLRPATPDGKPYIGRVPKLHNLIAATGHFRSGLTLAPITAEVVAQMIAGETPPFDLTPFAPGRER